MEIKDKSSRCYRCILSLKKVPLLKLFIFNNQSSSFWHPTLLITDKHIIIRANVVDKVIIISSKPRKRRISPLFLTVKSLRFAQNHLHSCGPAAAPAFNFCFWVFFQTTFFGGVYVSIYDAAQLLQFLDQSFPCLHGNSSCIGCCDKSQPITAVDEPSKGLRIQGQLVRKPSISDDFWSTSTCDLFENSALQSQRSFSSISISNQSLSQSSGSASNPPEFVNHGLLLWNQSRLQWLGTKKPQTHRKNQEPVLSWNASYDSLLGTSKRFPQPVPLSEMVDFLVDVWDQEGLYD